MQLEAALEFVDRLIYVKTGKRLSDLERKVFAGSWDGKTYEEIYPLNPQYVEKDVGYKLWQKLSAVLGEKVTKKKVQGAIERAQGKIEPLGGEVQVEKTGQGVGTVRVFISYWGQEPDLSLAIHLGNAIATVGHRVFWANIGVLSLPDRSEKNWLAQIDTELEQCQYFLLLLSPQTAISEMVIEKLRRLKELRENRCTLEPILLPIRVDYPASIPLNHDLRNYINGTQQREWQSPEDTPILLQEILDLISEEAAKKNNDRALENRTKFIVETEDISGGLMIPIHPLPASDSPCTSQTLPLNNPPSPVAEPELPQGQVRLDSAFYVERVPDEVLCYREILQPGALIRIKAPRQMGKTSLMARILYQAKEKGYRAVPLSFQHADAAVFYNLNELLRWFCSRIARKLRLPQQIDDYWTDTYGSKDNCTVYFEDCLLAKSDRPLVLGLDEVDRVFQYPKIADDFFGLLRAWYEEAGYGDSDSDLWSRLRLVVVHSTEVYIPLNVNQSPFNVGFPIELSEFNADQVSDLARRHGLNWQGHQVSQLMKVIGGHPYLVRVALYHIALCQLQLPALLEMAPTEAGIYGDHLRRHLWNLQQHPELGAAFSKVVTATEPVELESVLAFKLHSLGLVQLQGNHVTPRFELYRLYFGDRLGKF